MMGDGDRDVAMIGRWALCPRLGGLERKVYLATASAATAAAFNLK